ncbi:MAG: GDP-mannose 4,6-dehydratase [Candidatus Coatesbacteria bacterium]|nr:GDP-mannose 4,6-dehydratase [Candidatus Coatesbacteria bacterium]
MKALITGGAGFIGSHLCDALLARGDEVTVIDNLSTGSIENVSHLEGNKRFRLVIDTIMNVPVLEQLTAKADIVFHLAASVGVKYVIDNPLKSIQTNITGTENVLAAANRRKCKVILASTSEIYGKNQTSPLTEDAERILGSTTISRWSYSASKAVDEFLAIAYHREKQLPVVIVRLFNTCGPRQTGQYGMVIPRFIKQALLGHDVTVYGDGSQMRCFCFVGDTVSGILKLSDAPKAYGDVFNLGNDTEISIHDLAKLVIKLTKSESSIEFVPYEHAYEKGFEDIERGKPSIAKAAKLVGYKPEINLEEALKRTIEYFRE